MSSRQNAAKSENLTNSAHPAAAAATPVASASAPGHPAYGSVVDRRSGLDRREIAAALKKAQRLNAAQEDTDNGAAKDVDFSDANAAPTGAERRRGPGRRLSDFTRSAEEGELTSEQFLFVMAIEAFKRSNDRMFPTWCDVLEVVRLLGYRKTMPSELNLRNAEDWRESPLTPSNVRAPRWNENGKVDAERAKSLTADQNRRANDRRAA